MLLRKNEEKRGQIYSFHLVLDVEMNSYKKINPAPFLPMAD
jgi:hypothetical protein